MTRPLADPNDRYSYEDWMNDMATQEPELPPNGHPLQKLGERLAHFLDDDKFNECEALLLAGWDHDRIDRKTGQAWREDSSLEIWFPITAEELERTKRMFSAAISSLAEISRALAIPDNVASTANGNAEILRAIQSLQSRVADLQQYHDWAEPQITGDRARINIQLGIVRSLLDDPDYEPGPVDNEHWSPMHDELRARLASQPPAGEPPPASLVEIARELDASFDEQTHREQVLEEFDAPDDREYSVNITAKQLRALNRAVLGTYEPLPAKREGQS